MSLLVRPIGQSQITSGSSIGVLAGQTLAQIGALPPGWYLVQGSTSSASAAAFENLALLVGGRKLQGQLPTFSTPVAFEFVTWIQGNQDVAVQAIAADPAVRYSVHSLTVTPIQKLTDECPR